MRDKDNFPCPESCPEALCDIIIRLANDWRMSKLVLLWIICRIGEDSGKYALVNSIPTLDNHAVLVSLDKLVV